MTQRFIEASLERRTGMSNGGQERLDAANATATNWRATCCHCGLHLEGTIAQLQEHDCNG